MFDVLRLLFSAHEGLWPWLDLLFLGVAVFGWKSASAAFGLRSLGLASRLTRARLLLVHGLSGAVVTLGLGVFGWVRGQALFHGPTLTCLDADTLLPCSADAALALGVLGLGTGTLFLFAAGVGATRLLEARAA